MPKPQFYGYRHERKELSTIARRIEDKMMAATNTGLNVTPHKRKKGTKPYRIEFRLREEYWGKHKEYFWMSGGYLTWQSSGHNYETVRSREEALVRLNRTGGRFEYRREADVRPDRVPRRVR